MTCNNSFIHHDRKCPDYNNNALKGASAVATAVNQQPKQFVFNSNEVQILAKVLEICRLYINKNSSLFQQPQDIINDISTSIDIINTRQNKNNNKEANLKGASDINTNPFKSFDNILKMFGLTSNESATTEVSHIKGASDFTQNNICNKKEHLKDLLKQLNLI